MKRRWLSILSEVLCVLCLIMENVILTTQYHVSWLVCAGICCLAVMWALNGAALMIDLINKWDKEGRE